MIIFICFFPPSLWLKLNLWYLVNIDDVVLPSSTLRFTFCCTLKSQIYSPPGCFIFIFLFIFNIKQFALIRQVNQFYCAFKINLLSERHLLAKCVFLHKGAAIAAYRYFIFAKYLGLFLP